MLAQPYHEQQKRRSFIMDFKEFIQLPKNCQATIIRDTFTENETQTAQPYSIRSILEAHRELSVGCRMLGRGTITIDGNELTGKDIADMYKNNVKAGNTTYFPLIGKWEHTGIKRLVLFVKERNKYIPYVSFEIADILTQTEQSNPPEDYTEFGIPPKTFLSSFKYKTLIKIKSLTEVELPDSYLGVSSGKDIYECAFLGSSPNIFIL